MSSPAVYDHVFPPDDAGCPPGVYRVVGVTDGSVTLLRVADGDGRRVATGETLTVERDAFAAFTPAPNPDGSRSFEAVADAGYWSVRAFVRQLRARPLRSGPAIAAVLFGVGGDRFLDLPAPAFTVLVLAGSLALAALGSGRL